MPDLLTGDLGLNAAAMQRVLAEPVKVRVKGKLKTISKGEALQRVRDRKALSGDSILATRDLNTQLLEQDARARQAITDSHATWQDYLERWAADFAQARAAGTPPSQFWIEPEDILFRRNDLVDVRGPLAAAQIPHYAELEVLRDAMIAEAVYFGQYHLKDPPSERISIAALFAGLIDRQTTYQRVAMGKL